MFSVKWKDENGNECDLEFTTLDLAMQHSKSIGRLVTIKSDTYEIVGKFGADSVNNGKLPDGHDYTWMKRRNQ